MAFDAKRSAPSGRFLLEVGQSRAAYLKSFSGFAYEGEVGVHDHGPDNMQTKQLTTYKFSPAKAKVGLNQSGEMAEWIRASFKKQYIQKSGAFIAGDFDYKETHRMEFQNALMTEIAFCKLDASTKELGYMDVTFDAEDVTHIKGTGVDIRGDYNTAGKQWMPHMFRVEIAGLEDACKRIATVDPITFKQSVTPDAVGPIRIFSKHPSKVTVGDLKFSLSAADSQPWSEWADKWFRQGHCLASDHKDGAIVFLDGAGKDIGRIDIKQLGLKKFEHPEHTANAETIKRITVECYCEQLDIMFDGGSQR